MKILKFVLPLITLATMSCSDSFQYDVYIQNASTEDITVAFKSMKQRDGPIEDSVILKKGELKKIISTEDISWGKRQLMATREQCHQVAEYVIATKEDVESKIKWCDKSIAFEKVDLGQGMYTITYRDIDF